MTTATQGRIQALQDEGCPYNLTLSPATYLDMVNHYLDGIGQMDGYWTEQGEERIPELYPTSVMAAAIQETVEDEYEVRIHRDLVQGPLGKQVPWDLVSMSQMAGVELARGWVLFPVLDTKEQTHWVMRGMLFPDYGDVPGSWIVYLPADHVLGQGAE